MLPARRREHLVERRQARREAVQRKAELGHDVAEGVEVVVPLDRDLDEALVADRRQLPGGQAATSSSPRGPTSTVTTPVRSSSESVAPDTTRRPASIITTWSHTCWTSSRRWVAISTEMPNVRAGRRGRASATERVEPRRRFVEEHQLGIADQRLGELGALAHPRGEPLDRPEAGLVEADQIEDVGRPLASCPRRSPLSSPNVDTTSAAVWSSGRQSCSGM